MEMNVCESVSSAPLSCISSASSEESESAPSASAKGSAPIPSITGSASAPLPADPSTEGGTSSAEGDISSTEGGISSTEGGISSAESGISSAEGGISSAEGGTSFAEGDISSAEGGISSAESGISSAEGGTSFAEGDISSAEGGISSTEGGIEPTAEDFGAQAEADMQELSALFPALSPDGRALSLGELQNPTRFAELRAAGLTVEEAFLATNYRMLQSVPPSPIERKSDTPVAPALPRADGGCRAMPTSLLLRTRSLFEGLSDRELSALYRRVTNQ